MVVGELVEISLAGTVTGALMDCGLVDRVLTVEVASSREAVTIAALVGTKEFWVTLVDSVGAGVVEFEIGVVDLMIGVDEVVFASVFDKGVLCRGRAVGVTPSKVSTSI